MALTTFDQNILVAAPYEQVQGYLEKLMTNISEMHPFVIWTRHVQTTTAADGTKVDHYLVRDRMKLGPLPIEFTYRVDMNVTATGQLVSNAYQSPGIHLYNHTWCEREENGTRLREHIDITAPRLLMKTTYEGAANAHKELFTNLKAKIEREQTPASASQGE